MTESTAAVRLLAKLQAAGLDEDESDVLAAVFERALAATGEVEGYAAPMALVGTFPSRTFTAGFKGTDEELQIIDWLGSLEIGSPGRPR